LKDPSGAFSKPTQPLFICIKITYPERKMRNEQENDIPRKRNLQKVDKK
jgi:hypothetical protein